MEPLPVQPGRLTATDDAIEGWIGVGIRVFAEHHMIGDGDAIHPDRPRHGFSFALRRHGRT